MSEVWWSIEVLDGVFTAARWKDAHSAALIEAALSHGAQDWNWHEHRWGVVFEVAFRDADDWVSFRRLAAVSAALDAVPDPLQGLLIYQGRGGSSSSAEWRRPRPHLGAGAAPLPEEPLADLVAHLSLDVRAAEVQASEERMTRVNRVLARQTRTSADLPGPAADR